MIFLTSKTIKYVFRGQSKTSPKNVLVTPQSKSNIVLPFDAIKIFLLVKFGYPHKIFGWERTNFSAELLDFPSCV